MAAKTNDYLSHLCESMAQLLSDIISEERSIPLFKRSAQVQLSAPAATSSDYHLCIAKRELFEDDNGSFTCQASSDTICVFRNPIRMKVSFLLASPALTPTARLKAYDRLTTYFFDNRSIEPLLPESFKEFPDLLTRMRSQKAELRVSEPSTDSPWLSRSPNSFSFGFDYTALYHSGNPLREEQRVKTRIIDFGNDANKRSML